MFENIKVQDCMTHPALTVSSKVSVRLAQQMMHDYHIRHLPVVDDHRLVGMLSSGDIRRASPSSAATLGVWEMRGLWERVRVGEVMSRHPINISRNTSLLEAIRLLYQHRFNSLPVLDELGQLVGILTEVDLYLLLLQSSEQESAKPTLRHMDDYPVAATP